jgi:hypothetical protein
MLVYEAPHTSSYSDATLVVSIVPNGPNASAIRADGQTVWIPTRPASESVSPGTSSILVVASDGMPSHEIARRTLTGRAAGLLAKALDGLRRDNRGAHGCADDGGFRVAMTFVTGHGTLVLTENPACYEVAAALDGVRQPVLFDTPSLQRLLRSLLGLPAIR